MEILISNSSDKPIYEQICMQIKSLIMNGTLAAGEALPCTRKRSSYQCHHRAARIRRSDAGRIYRNSVRQRQLCSLPKPGIYP